MIAHMCICVANCVQVLEQYPQGCDDVWPCKGHAVHDAFERFWVDAAGDKAKAKFYEPQMNEKPPWWDTTAPAKTRIKLPRGKKDKALHKCVGDFRSSAAAKKWKDPNSAEKQAWAKTGMSTDNGRTADMLLGDDCHCICPVVMRVLQTYSHSGMIEKPINMDCRRWTADPSGWELLKVFGNSLGKKVGKCVSPNQADFTVLQSALFLNCTLLQELFTEAGAQDDDYESLYVVLRTHAKRRWVL
jgi:hypothetical protein